MQRVFLIAIILVVVLFWLGRRWRDELPYLAVAANVAAVILLLLIIGGFFGLVGG